MSHNKPKFYLDKPGTYSDIKVAHDAVRIINDKRVNVTEVRLKDKILAQACFVPDVLFLFADNVVSTGGTEVVNELFTQLNRFRGLMTVSEDERVFLILDGEKVLLDGTTEIFYANNEFFLSTRLKKFLGHEIKESAI